MTIISNNIVLIGSSTGGPRTLTELFQNLPKLKTSIIIIQHMPQFINTSIQMGLNKITEMTVQLACNGEYLTEGNVYIAPSGVHLTLQNNRRICLFNGEKVNFVRPSIDIAMKSIKNNGKDIIVGIILTGMGRDGAKGITYIKSIGGLTIAQDEKSSIIYGMPKEAYKTGKIDFVLSPKQIQEKLITLF